MALVLLVCMIIGLASIICMFLFDWEWGYVIALAAMFFVLIVLVLANAIPGLKILLL